MTLYKYPGLAYNRSVFNNNPAEQIMSDKKESNLTQEVIDQLNVVTLPGAASLKEDELLIEVQHALSMLKNQDPFTSKVVHLESSPYVAAILESEGSYTMLIGFGLEVIQAVQKHEKK